MPPFSLRNVSFPLLSEKEIMMAEYFKHLQTLYQVEIQFSSLLNVASLDNSSHRHTWSYPEIIYLMYGSDVALEAQILMQLLKFSMTQSPCWHHYLQLTTVSCHPLLETSPMLPTHNAFSFLPSFHHVFTFTGKVLAWQHPCWGPVTLVEPHLWYLIFHCSSFTLFSKLCRKLLPNWPN